MSQASSDSAGSPEDQDLEWALRKVVQELYRTGDLENLTVKRGRRAAEERLDLDEGFFRQHETWKDRSKAIIQSEVVSMFFCKGLV